MRQPSFIRRTLGASAFSVLFLPACFADEPPAEAVEDLSTTVKQVAEQAIEAAKEAAIEAAEEAQRSGAEATEAAAAQAQKAAQHAQEAAEGVAKDAEKAAREMVKKVKRNGSLSFESGYQLEMHVTPVPAVLNAQLKLDGKGVLVDNVEKEGPAAKAGVQAFDVLVAVEDKPLAGAKDLYTAVQASDGKELALKLIRAGETHTVKLTPIKRSSLTTDVRIPTEEVEIEVRKLETSIREKLKNAGLDVRWQLIRPGHMLPSGATFVSKLRIPDDLTLIIKKTGEQPAEITVNRGEESWSAQEGDISALPEEVRPYVGRLLGPAAAPFAITLPGKPGMPMPVTGMPVTGMPVPVPGVPATGVPVPPGVTISSQGPFVIDREMIEEYRERLDRVRKDIGSRKETGARRVSDEKHKEIGRGGVERRLEIMSRELARMNEQMQALERELRHRSAAEDEEEIEIEIKMKEDGRDEASEEETREEIRADGEKDAADGDDQ